MFSRGPAICWVHGKHKPARFLETAILFKVFPGKFETKLFLFFAVISARSCFYVCICLIIRFVYLVYFCFSAMIFSIFHLSIVNIYCCLYCTPGVYIKSPMLFLHSSYLHLFSKKTLDSLVSDLRVLWLNDLLGFSFCSFNFVSRIT